MDSRDPDIQRTQSHRKELTAWEVQVGQSGKLQHYLDFGNQIKGGRWSQHTCKDAQRLERKRKVSKRPETFT